MIIDNETIEILIKMIKQNSQYRCKSIMEPQYDFYKMMHIMIDFNGIEYELFPVDEDWDINLRMLFSGRSLIEIKNALMNSMNLTVYCPFSVRKEFYSAELNDFLEKMIMKAQIVDLTNKVNVLVDLCVCAGVVCK